VWSDAPTDQAVLASLEEHEARVWAHCVQMTADSLGPAMGDAGGVALPALTALDDDSFNRVVGLGVRNPATESQVTDVVEFYRGLGQRRFRVELAPFAAPSGLSGWLRDAGLELGPETFTKKWCDLRTVESPPVPEDVDVRILDAGDADRVGSLNVRAWGAWLAPVSLQPWFAATVGRDGFVHYGAFVDDVLRTVGAMVVDGDLAWIGFDATDPRLRSRGLRQALTARRVADAGRAGARFVHAEVRTLLDTGRHNLLDRAYERSMWLSVVP